MLEELFIVRHAQPNRGLSIPYHIPPGPPLTPQGHAEAAQAAAWLASYRIDLLGSSPFERTTTTAQAIATTLGREIQFFEALREGSLSETAQQVQTRISELLAQLEDSPYQRVALVSHGVCIRSILEITSNHQIDLKRHVYDYGNCSPTAGIWRGVRQNQHWQWELAFRPNVTDPAAAEHL